MKRLVICAALTLVVLPGCRSVSIVDDIDLELDFAPLVGPSDKLHSPYVLGSSMTLFVDVRNGNKPTGWTIESSDASVLEVGPLSGGAASARAGGEGTAEVSVRDANGSLVARQAIEVLAPDQVALLAHGILLIGRNEAAATMPELRVRAGGTATFLAHYYRDARLLSGNGALGVDAPAGVDARVVPTFLFEDRDWLQVTPSVQGNSALTLRAGGRAIGVLPLIAVPDTDVAAVAILGMDEKHARRDDPLIALAQASDVDSRVIYGVDYQWDLDGAPQEGLGDLYRYNFNPDEPKILRAQFGAMSAEAMIHGQGFVDSSNHLGCSFVPGGFMDRSMALFFVIVIGLALAVRYMTGPE